MIQILRNGALQPKVFKMFTLKYSKTIQFTIGVGERCNKLILDANLRQIEIKKDNKMRNI